MTVGMPLSLNNLSCLFACCPEFLHGNTMWCISWYSVPGRPKGLEFYFADISCFTLLSDTCVASLYYLQTHFHTHTHTYHDVSIIFPKIPPRHVFGCLQGTPLFMLIWTKMKVWSSQSDSRVIRNTLGYWISSWECGRLVPRVHILLFLWSLLGL